MGKKNINNDQHVAVVDKPALIFRIQQKITWRMERCVENAQVVEQCRVVACTEASPPPYDPSGI